MYYINRITAGSYSYGQGYDYSAYGYYNQAGSTAAPPTTATSTR